mmetsp:Transcript_30429/g.81846  ORF Transcript_30429/g.81846 Transcript_30429/m.81846 type:complete len:228 (-) Transcript_30429:1016-1699(-)
MCFLSSRALLYLDMSLMPFHEELAASQTHLSCPLIESFHLASQVTLLSWITEPHLCALPSPRSGTGGTVTPLPMLMVMSSGMIRFFTCPRFGWSPRPRKRPGGSTRKLPTFSLRLSMVAKMYDASCAWRACLSASFSSLVRSFFLASSALTCSAMRVKSHLAKSLTAFPSGVFTRSLRQSSKKFSWNFGSLPKSVSFMAAKKVHTSSWAGVSTRGEPSYTSGTPWGV